MPNFYTRISQRAVTRLLDKPSNKHLCNIIKVYKLLIILLKSKKKKIISTYEIPHPYNKLT